MKSKAFLLIILFIIICSSTVQAYKVIEEGTRAIKYDEAELKNVASVFETKRDARFASSISKIYAGGRKDAMKALGLRLNMNKNPLGIISHGEVTFEKGPSNLKKVLHIKKYKGRKAQFEYATENLIFTADDMSFYIETKKKGREKVKVVTIFGNGNPIIEQNGVRLKPVNKSQGTSRIKIIEFPNGYRRAYFISYDPLYAYVLDKYHQENHKKRTTVSEILGRIPANVRTDLTIISMPFLDNNFMKIKKMKMRGGIIRYEENYNPSKIRVVGADIWVRNLQSGVTFEVMRIPKRQSSIRIADKLTLKDGEVTVFTNSAEFNLCNWRKQNCLLKIKDELKVNFRHYKITTHLEWTKYKNDHKKVEIKNINKGSKLVVFAEDEYQEKNLTFIYDKLLIDPEVLDWTNSRISFKMPVYFYSKKHKLECNAKTKKCYVDGKRTYADINVRVCPWVKCFPSIEKCVNNICVISGKGCKPYSIKGPSKSKLDILIIGDGYITNKHFPYLNIQRHVTQTFEIEPYKNHRDKFNLYTLDFKSGQIPRAPSGMGFFEMLGINLPRKYVGDMVPSGMEIEKIKETFCNHADQVVVISDKTFVPHAQPPIIMVPTSAISGFHVPSTIGHEWGHSIGGLNDEYYITWGVSEDSSYEQVGVNCVETKKEALKKFGTIRWKGCEGICFKADNCDQNYRPSFLSIMNNIPVVGSKFNRFSYNELDKELSRYR